MTTRHIPPLLLLLLLVWCIPSSYAATYYVTPAGGGGGCSTNSSSPQTGLTNGIACLSPGDTLIAKAGVYNEVISDTIPSGSSGAPTTVKSETYLGAKLRPTTKAIDGYSIILLGLLGDRSYITIDGFELDGSLLAAPIGGVQVRIQDPNATPPLGDIHHITLQNLEIHHFLGNQTYADSNGLSVSLNAHHNRFTNVKIHDIGYNETDADNGGINLAYCAYYSGKDNTLEQSEWYRCAGFAVHQYGGTHGGLDRNIFRNNYFHDNGGGLLIACGGQQNQVYNNVVAGNGLLNIYHVVPGAWRNGIKVGGSCSGTVSGDNLIYNNTVYNNGLQCISIGNVAGDGGSVDNNIVQNNICYQNGTDVAANNHGVSNTIDHNVLGVNPLFAAPGSGDFHLTTGSPAINAGVNVSSLFTTDLAGSARPASGAWDAGAYVFGLPTPLPAAQVEFSVQPSTTVVSTTLPPFTVQVQDSTGGVITTATDTITLQLVSTQLPQSSLTVVSVDSEETSTGTTFLKGNVRDGNLATDWHTQFVGGSPPTPHNIVVSFPSGPVNGVRYTPRQGPDFSGQIAQYEVYVSTDGSTWGSPVALGTFGTQNTGKAYGVSFAPKTGGFLKLVAASTLGGQPYTGMAELNVLMQSSVVPTGTLSVAAVAGVATFSDVVLGTVGDQYVFKATSTTTPTLTPQLSTPFTITASTPTPPAQGASLYKYVPGR